MKRITVLGGGSWGTALAWLLGEKGLPICLWCRDPAQAQGMAETRRNERYLPDLPLPESVHPTADLAAACRESALIVLAVPTQAVRPTLAMLRELPAVPDRLLIAAKGLERETGRRLSEIAADELPCALAAVLSGPNLSGEVVQGIPTATVIAAEDPTVARELQETFSTSRFRIYTNADLIGVELGGALKNPIAITAGICDGLGWGNNSKSSILTRGLAEMTRLGMAAGARAETFSGLSGLGDLIATAHSPLSRNYRLGLALGRGDTLEHARESLHQVAEGVPTTDAACRLADRLGVDAPILRELHQVLFEGAPIQGAVESLLTRPYRGEG